MQSAVLAMIDSVRPTDRPSHAGIMPHDTSYDLYSFLTVNFAAKFQRNMGSEGAE